jgi:LCP family protein required for cell wall assembly
MFKPSYLNVPHQLPEQPHRSHSVAYLVLAGIIIGGAVLGFSFFIQSFKQKSPEIAHTNTTLLPSQDASIFGSLHNFFFSNSAPALEGQAQNRINLLLLGVGGPGHDGSYLSDTNIIMSIKPSSGEVAMISIPRDLMVKSDVYGYQKINAISSYSELRNPGQGGELTRQFFQKQFNIEIPYFVRIDFQAFKDIIDAVGGVEVDVPVSFTDYRYPGPNYSYQTVSFSKGSTTLNGEQALIYSRSRHGNNGEGSDFARSRRQQQVMLALKQKLLSAGTLANPLVLKDIYDSLSTHVTTNLTLNEIGYLANLSQHITKERIKNVVIDDTKHGLISPLSNQLGDVLVPKSGNFDQINSFIAGVFENVSSTTALDTPNLIPSATTPTTNTLGFSTSSARISSSSAVIDIYNGTWEVGLAARAKKFLETKGYFIRSVGNSSERPVTITSIYGQNQSIDPTLLTTLATEVPGKIGKIVPVWLTPTSSPTSTPTTQFPPADVIILIGTDFKIR